MKRGKWKVSPAAVLLLAVLFTLASGCQKESAKQQESQNGYQIYYLNTDETAVVSVDYEPQQEGEEEQIQELLDKLASPPLEEKLEAVLTKDVFVERYELAEGQLSLHFSPAYQEMNKQREILCRSAVVRTLCQLPQVEYVSFLVGDSPLMDSKETPIGAMSADSFVENTADVINTYSGTTLKLYFANETGDKLKEELVRVDYSTSNMSMEKLVLEQLIRGPVSEDVYPVIPPETKVLSVSTKDSICYVNLDNGFMGQGYNVTEAVPVYAIVDSLTELPGIIKVQILINGETDLTYRESIRFDTIFERNLDIIEQEEAEE